MHVNAACPCGMPLHVHSACPCYMYIMHVHTAYPCSLSMLHVHDACPYRVCMLLVHAVSMLHFNATWSCSIFNASWYAACLWCIYVFYFYLSILCFPFFTLFRFLFHLVHLFSFLFWIISLLFNFCSKTSKNSTLCFALKEKEFSLRFVQFCLTRKEWGTQLKKINLKNSRIVE
jgi:hypothetical protein